LTAKEIKPENELQPVAAPLQLLNHLPKLAVRA